jgi:hypothetical protein
MLLDCIGDAQDVAERVLIAARALLGTPDHPLHTLEKRGVDTINRLR